MKELRKELGMTQMRLADELGIYQPTVARWETGARTPSPTIVMLLECMLEKRSLEAKIWRMRYRAKKKAQAARV